MIPQHSVKHAIGGFFRALISGLEQDHLVETVKAVEGGSSLQIELRTSVIGNVATRSRVPAEWVLLPKIQVWMDDNDDDDEQVVGTKLRLSGIQVIPIEGATEAWKELAALFIEQQAETLNDRRSVAWKWWNETGRDTHEGTKLWRIVESLALLGFGQAVPTYAKASLLLGCCLGVHQDVTSLHYRFNSGNNNDESSGSGEDSSHNTDYQGVDVVGTQDPVAATCDIDSPEFNCNEEMKDEIGLALWQETVSSPFKRATAAKCARSSLNYAALFCAREGRELGASPESVEKLVTVARNFGGATKIDVMKGKASTWQYEDETYQMTGNDGRIVWKPLD